MNTAPLPLYLGHSIPLAHLHFDGTLSLLAAGHTPITIDFLDKLFTAAATEGWHITELQVIGADETCTEMIKDALRFQVLADGLSICFRELDQDEDDPLSPTVVHDLTGRAVHVGDSVAVIIRENGREDRLEQRVVSALWLGDTEATEILAWKDANNEDGYDYCEASQAALVIRKDELLTHIMNQDNKNFPAQGAEL